MPQTPEEPQTTSLHPYKCIKNILEEFIATEETYVQTLWKGINNYSNIFQRSDLPEDLEGKEYDLLGNIETIANFHRDQILPMLQSNRENAEKFFIDFRQLVEVK